MMKKYIFLLVFLLIFSVFVSNYTCFATPPEKPGEAELSLENNPEVGGIAIIKIKAIFHGDIPNTAISKARISCGIPDGLEFINDKNYKVERMQSDAPKEWFDSVTLYEGPMKKMNPKKFYLR